MEESKKTIYKHIFHQYYHNMLALTSTYTCERMTVKRYIMSYYFYEIVLILQALRYSIWVAGPHFENLCCKGTRMTTTIRALLLS